MSAETLAARPPLARAPALSPAVGRGLRGAAGIALLFALWQLSVPLVGLEPYFYPAPTDVLQAFLDLMRKGILPAYLADSIDRFAVGVAAGAAAGLAAGLLIGLSRTATRLLSPLINFFFAIVEVAWIPIFVIWWGYGFKTIVISLAYVVFFPVLFNTMVGIRTVPQVCINAARTLGAGAWQVLLWVVLPSALPNIITGFRVGAGFAFRGLIFAEIIAAKSGIGFLIFESATNQQTARTIVGMIVMGLSWLLVDRLYIRPLERLTIERWGTVTRAEDRE